MEKSLPSLENGGDGGWVDEQLPRKEGSLRYRSHPSLPVEMTWAGIAHEELRRADLSVLDRVTEPVEVNIPGVPIGRSP